MYGTAITIAACLRSGTRADVAWIVDSDGIPVTDWSDAVVFTPGGGRIGSMAGGVLDGKLSDLAGRRSTGRLVLIEVTEIDAMVEGLSSGGSARCLIVPADEFPVGLLELAFARQPFCLVSHLDGDEVTAITLYGPDTIAEAGEAVAELFGRGASRSETIDGDVVSVFRAVPQMVIIGSTPVADALAELAAVVGWRAQVLAATASATGVIATLSGIDSVVVTGHDLELTGAALMAALDSDVGYIGSLGALKMQENRADWLAYRGVTDLARVHGPAGIDIGADTPAEIAVSILAEAIAEHAADRVDA